MQNWQTIRRHIETILNQQEYHGIGSYKRTRCFLTAYQIAVLVDQADATLKGSLPIGGDQVGISNSFAKEIARGLSKEIQENPNGRLEIQFFSISGLDTFTFDGTHKPSLNAFSMFRVVDFPAVQND